MAEAARVEGPAGERTERRGGDRRRSNALGSHWIYGFRGRRRRSRRAGDRRGAAVVVDSYSCPLLVLALTVVVLSGCDAAFTMTLLEHGLVEEANPFMRALIGIDVDLFVGTKLAITGIGVISLVAFSQLLLLGRLPLSRVLAALSVFYVCLVSYQVTLLSMI